MKKQQPELGIVLWFDRRDRNGIIKGSHGKKYYFDISVLKSASVSALDTVYFDLRDGNDCAWNVRVLTNLLAVQRRGEAA